MRMILDSRGHYFPGDSSFPTLARQMDHDIRSPLTAICSYAECLAWLPNLEPSVRESYAYTILAEARRLGRLASSFLALAAPPLSDDLDEVDLGLAVDAALGDLQDMIQLQGFRAEWQRPAETMVIWPQGVLQQLLTAALETALEAAKGNACLLVTVTEMSEEEVAVELSSARCEPSRAAETFAFRATEVLARQRGGAATLDTGSGMCLTLRLPRVGRVRGVLEDSCLERSA